MKVLHLIDSPDRGGAEILALDLFKNAKKNGLDISVVVTKKGALFDEFKSSGVDFYFIERKMPIDFNFIFQLRRLIKEKQIDIIHVHQAVDGIHAYFACINKNVKKVMTFHGNVPSIKDDFVLKFLIPRMNSNIAVSNSFLDRLKYDIKFDTSRNFHVIYNGIDTKKFYKTNKNFRNELKLSDTDLLLGMVGNFYNDGRDQMTICKALPFIFNNYPNVHFAFIGGRSDIYPHYFDNCLNFCKNNDLLDRIHFVGLRSDTNDILNSLDIFIFSSNHDTFGIAVVEAMLSNLPVIINDLPPLVEVTDGGKFAKVFKSKNVEDLKENIIELIENPIKRLELAVKGKEWAMSQFSIERYISNLKNLYISLT